MRVARLESDGVPLPGANNLYVTGVIELSITPEVEAGQEIVQKDGCDNVCINYKSPDKIRRYNVELSICAPDPQLTELLVGGDVLTDGNAVGWAHPPLNTVDQANIDGVSIELWSKAILADGSQDPNFPYYWWALPRVNSLRLGARRWFNGALENPFIGIAVENENWWNGPANDWPTPPADRVLQYIPTDSLPNIACGYQTTVAS